MNDLKNQLEQMQKMGGLKSLMGMMPGMGKLAKNIDDKSLYDSVIKRQIALIQSMTKKERLFPNVLQASRKKRIALGAGLEVPELNKLIKLHRQMSGKGDGISPSMPDAQVLQRQLGSKLPTNLSGLTFKK